MEKNAVLNDPVFSQILKNKDLPDRQKTGYDALVRLKLEGGIFQ